jgi:hypothetical protein
MPLLQGTALYQQIYRPFRGLENPNQYRLCVSRSFALLGVGRGGNGYVQASRLKAIAA